MIVALFILLFGPFITTDLAKEHPLGYFSWFFVLEWLWLGWLFG